jgi:hypothetical protein
MIILVQFLVPDVKIQSAIFNVMAPFYVGIGVHLVQMIIGRVVMYVLAGPSQKREKHLLAALIQRGDVCVILL